MIVLEKNRNTNNNGHMYLEQPVSGGDFVVVGVVVGTCCCCLYCCLLTRHNHIDCHLVVNSVAFLEDIP